VPNQEKWTMAQRSVFVLCDSMAPDVPGVRLGVSIDDEDPLVVACEWRITRATRRLPDITLAR
jgi:hypothetical protein